MVIHHIPLPSVPSRLIAAVLYIALGVGVWFLLHSIGEENVWAKTGLFLFILFLQRLFVGGGISSSRWYWPRDRCGDQTAAQSILHLTSADLPFFHRRGHGPFSRKRQLLPLQRGFQIRHHRAQ